MSLTATRVHQALASLLREIVAGSGTNAAWILNPGDPGLVRSLDKLSAAAASAAPPGGGPSIAAHVDHVRYGLELANRWSRGENPFADADYSASWRRQGVSEREWAALRERLRSEADRWVDVVREPREVRE